MRRRAAESIGGSKILAQKPSCPTNYVPIVSRIEGNLKAAPTFQKVTPGRAVAQPGVTFLAVNPPWDSSVFVPEFPDFAALFASGSLVCESEAKSLLRATRGAVSTQRVRRQSGRLVYAKRPPNSRQHSSPAYASSVSTSSLPASCALPCDPSAFTKVSRAARASDSFSARFAFATEIISLMRLSWFTSDAPGS